jgi:unsaturated rhamnogalacturonyl hydrolase
MKHATHALPTLQMPRTFALFLLTLALALAGSSAIAQTPAPSPVDRNAAGDSPDNPGPLATDVSPAITHAAIRHAAAKVADWQLGHAEKTFNRQWTYAALYDGLLAASKTTGDPRYHDAVAAYAQSNDWSLINNRFPHADDMAFGKAYMELYLESPKAKRDPKRMADTKAILDQLVVRADDPKKLLWWWCDALYMAPPVLARMSLATGDRKYLDYMDKEWWETSASLYNPTEHLYFRDATFFDQHEKNGKPVFWTRGNGWVMGAFTLVLEAMPKDYPSRAKYIAQYKEMADRIAALQRADGLWGSGLLDPAAYDLPEISGSAFFTYSFAWGINHGILDRKKFQPVVTKSWTGVITHIYADGRLGSIQPIGAAPGKFQPSSSYVYGVGSFLLAASELDKMAKE